MNWVPYRAPSVETDTVRVGSAISQIAKRLGVGDLTVFDHLCQQWSSIVGSELEGHIEPARIENNVLFVTIEEHSWRATLKWIAPKMIEAINREIPSLEITSIRAAKDA